MKIIIKNVIEIYIKKNKIPKNKCIFFQLIYKVNIQKQNETRVNIIQNKVNI